MTQSKLPSNEASTGAPSPDRLRFSIRTLIALAFMVTAFIAGIITMIVLSFADT